MLSQDKSFDFEKRRHEPVKYDRVLWQQAVKAIQQVEEVKRKRQAQFIKNR